MQMLISLPTQAKLDDLAAVWEAHYFHWLLEAPPLCFVFLISSSICWRQQHLKKQTKKNLENKLFRLFVANLSAAAVDISHTCTTLMHKF